MNSSMMIPLCSVLGALFAVGCESSDDGGNDSNSLPAAVETETPERDAAAADPNDPKPGPITCCQPGEGTSCCTEAAPYTCFAYGDSVDGDGLDRCRELGEQVGGKAICPADCCDGLARVPNLVPGPDGCEGSGHMGISVCLLCGDGVCDDLENACNCPEDCPP